MMKVKVRFLQELYQLAGKHEIEYELPEGSTVRELLEILPENVKKTILDEKGEVRYPAEIAVNGRRIEFLEGLNTKLNDGDVVVVSPRALFVV